MTERETLSRIADEATSLLEVFVSRRYRRRSLRTNQTSDGVSIIVRFARTRVPNASWLFDDVIVANIVLSPGDTL